MKTVYMVSFEGYTVSYGSYTYCAGVFDNKDTAREVRDKVKQKLQETIKEPEVVITAIELNYEFEVKGPIEWHGYKTDFLLGGYAE